MKFDRLLAQATDLRCDVLVTGHYARIRRAGKTWRLLKGVDPHKDQSYVLYMLGQPELARVRFPIGEMSKADTRRVAVRLDLRTAAKRESQDICFVGNGDYRSFVGARAAGRMIPGPILDHDGRQLGEHAGVAGFTIGQRKGLGVAVGEARYVTAVVPETATVVVGRREHLLASGARLERVSWVAGFDPEPGKVDAKIRYNSPAVSATLTRDAKAGWAIRFDRPQPAVAPGQAAVLFQGSEVIGGGTIVGKTAAAGAE